MLKNDLPIAQMAEKMMDLASFRQSLIANNMANVDTPEFKTKDIDFRAELRRAAMSDAPSAKPAVKEPAGLLQRPDGNNVSLEREGLNMAETQLQFAMGAQLVKREYRKLLSAINEGR